MKVSSYSIRIKKTFDDYRQLRIDFERNRYEIASFKDGKKIWCIRYPGFLNPIAMWAFRRVHNIPKQES